MSKGRLPFLIQTSRWRPDVTILDNQIGIKIDVNSQGQPELLTPGRYVHWPMLSKIVVLDTTEHQYAIQPDFPLKQFGDQAIVAVSHDHHLFTVTGIIQLQLATPVNASLVAGINSRYMTHRLRPRIRQVIRQCLADWSAADLNQTSKFRQQLHQQLGQHLAELGLQVTSLPSLDIQSFQYPITLRL